jgi:hypothetical protein
MLEREETGAMALGIAADGSVVFVRLWDGATSSRAGVFVG